MTDILREMKRTYFRSFHPFVRNGMFLLIVPTEEMNNAMTTVTIKSLMVLSYELFRDCAYRFVLFLAINTFSTKSFGGENEINVTAEMANKCIVCRLKAMLTHNNQWKNHLSLNRLLDERFFTILYATAGDAAPVPSIIFRFTPSEIQFNGL